MRIAIFSDIRGNLQALEAVLADVAAQKPDTIYCYVVMENGTVTFRRVEYDVNAAAAAIRASDLPHEFAAEIETGGLRAASTPSR